MSFYQKYLIVFGTRPEAIKLAPLIVAFKKSGIAVRVCVTGQHRHMLDQVLDFFDIVPDIDLNIMTPGQTLNGLASELFNRLDEVYSEETPDWVLVHGDTTTSSIAAWAAFHRGIRVAHIEAGLRTYDKKAPFPEELNRQITSRIADLHFAPTSNAAANLLTEGIDPKSIVVTGNTVIDALNHSLKLLQNGYSNAEIEVLNTLFDAKKKLILVTGHRRENFGQGMIEICAALKELASENIQIIYPVHLNPNIKDTVFQFIGSHPGILLVEPLGYPAFVYLMSRSYLILTDSGGIQEEGLSMQKPVLVMRDTTERPEALDSGGIKLVGADRQAIVAAVRQMLDDDNLYKQMIGVVNPYGDGKASERILKALVK